MDSEFILKNLDTDTSDERVKLMNNLHSRLEGALQEFIEINYGSTNGIEMVDIVNNTIIGFTMHRVLSAISLFCKDKEHRVEELERLKRGINHYISIHKHDMDKDIN